MDFKSMLSKLKQDASKPQQSSSSTTSSSQPPKKKVKTGHNSNNTNDTNNYPFPKRKVSTVYLACPPNVQTGGPEAMHQLCHKINSLSSSNNDTSNSTSDSTSDSTSENTSNSASNSTSDGVTAYMLFIKERPGGGGGVQHVTNVRILHAYESIYSNLKIATSFPMQNDNDYDIGNDTNNDNESISIYNDSLIVWPECWTHFIDSLQLQEVEQEEELKVQSSSKYNNKRYQTAIWWLSVDNNNSKFKQWDRKDILHLHQSEYAKCYLRDNLQKAKVSMSSSSSSSSLSIMPMTEFIPKNRHYNEANNDATTSSSTKTTPKKSTRSLQIVYNPFKGVHYTDSIINRSNKQFKFTPIGSIQKRISPTDVTKLLNQAKVYIDFGPHPGMDRLPREAAIAGCIVICNTQGAAYYDEDVPIPKIYKIKDFNIDSIHRLLVSSIDDYDERRKDFDSYRVWIDEQESRMDCCVKDFLKYISSCRSIDRI